LVDAATEKGRFGRVIEMRILEALAHQRRGDYEKGIEVLFSAMTQAKSEGYIRVFLDEGPRIRELLWQISSQDIENEFASKLLNAFNLTLDLDQPQSTISSPQSSLVESLSERELEVLHLLSLGATNQEIASELVIALTTAKKHVSNIIGKLGVINRTQAVAKARNLDLI
jgi:LuxR family maltose regulon positive regulatory protein